MPTTRSSQVSSNQEGIYNNLDKVVTRHLNSTFRKPFEQYNIDAYQTAVGKVAGRELIVDSGCGNGRSTRKLAKQFPDAFVIGIDKSAARITRGINRYSDPFENACIVQADLHDFWRLAVLDQLRVQKHFILYPNPWPKSQHFARRWHGSPLLKSIVELGGELELRSNWCTYAREFQRALQLAGKTAKLVELNTSPEDDMTDFETKYRSSGHKLWRLTAHLDVDK